MTSPNIFNTEDEIILDSGTQTSQTQFDGSQQQQQQQQQSMPSQEMLINSQYPEDVYSYPYPFQVDNNQTVSSASTSSASASASGCPVQRLKMELADLIAQIQRKLAEFRCECGCDECRRRRRHQP